MLQEAVAERPVPGGGHLKYATQVSACPPTFVLFGARAPDAAYQRFLEGRLRRAFGFDGVPVRLSFRGAPQGRHARRSRTPSYRAQHEGRTPRLGTIAHNGPWRSLVSASDWGSEGRRFKSGRPDIGGTFAT